MPDTDSKPPFQPLSGLTILAWEQWVTLPIATRLFADLGATVIRVDAHVRNRQRPRYLSNDLVRNKLSIAIDLREERGQTLMTELVRHADALCENFTPRVKRHFNLTYEQLVQVRPDLIMLSLTAYGQTGAWANRPTFGPGIEASSGHIRSMGFEDGPPVRPSPGYGNYADKNTGMHAAVGLLAALRQRRETGKGQYIDISMYEANVHHLYMSLAASSISGLPVKQRGNGDPVAAIQDAFPSEGYDLYVAVTVYEKDLPALAKLLGTAEDVAMLEPALRAWAAVRTPDAASAALQEVGIAASPVATGRDLLLDPQLRHRGAFTLVEHVVPIEGYRSHPHLASPWLFDDRPRPVLNEAPAVGQDTRYVLQHWLQMSDAEVDELVEAGVIGEAPPGAGLPAEGERARLAEAEARKRIEWRLVQDYDPDPERTIGLDPDAAGGALR